VSDRTAPPPPIAPAIAPRRRPWLWLILGVSIPVASLAVLGGLALQLSGWRAFHMPSGSMLPGLLVGDHFFVDRTAYAGGRQARRGDLVVYRVPDGAGPLARWNDRPVEFVNRVIGLPGERIEMRKGAPVINGRVAIQESLGEFPYGPASHRGATAKRLREHFADGTTFDILKYARNGPADEGGPLTVPAGSYFVMGDNRDDSLDGRAGWWFVPAESLIGRVTYIYWSGFDRLDRIGLALR